MGENAHISISEKHHHEFSQRFGSSNEVPHPLIVAEEFPHTRHAHPNDDFENEPIRHQKISGTRVTLQGGPL